MRVIHHILGSRQDAEMAHRLHHLEHHGAVDVLVVPGSDVARRRIRATTQAGEEIALALPRDAPLFDGAVLALDDRHAIVARVGTERWLRLVPQSRASALELGYHAGNLHWRVRFADDAILVALDGPAADYLVRLGALVTDGQVTHTILDGAEPC
ncbi:urease accessory protein UreE [Methylobacterium mesophilicum]